MMKTELTELEEAGRREQITESIGESQDGIRQAESNASRIEESSIRAGDLIGESQSILSGIRERGEKEE